jgi:hypothetical protein
MKEQLESSGIPLFTSTGQCAAHSGVPVSVLKTAKAKGCPAFVGNKVNLKTFLEWHFAQTTMDDFSTDWKNDKAKSDALLARMKVQEEEKSIIQFSVVESFHADFVGQVFGDLTRIFCNEMPPTLKGLDEIAIRLRCDAEIEAMKKTLRSKLEDWEHKHLPQETKKETTP